MAGILESIDNLLGTRLGLLVSDPRAAMQQMNQQAGAFNQASLLATQAERNAMRGRPITPEQAAAKQYVDKVNEDLALAFAGNIKTVGKTPYEIAQEVAQKNATKMLGLPANNTAMDRAKALGFDTPVYRGTTADEMVGKERNFVSENKDVANEYAGYLKDFADDPKMLEAMMKLTPYGNVMPLLVKDAAKARARTNIPDYEMILDANQARSRFAAFDPARINEPDLLAAGIPLGFLAGTNVEMPKKKQKK